MTIRIPILVFTFCSAFTIAGVFYPATGAFAQG